MQKYLFLSLTLPHRKILEKCVCISQGIVAIYASWGRNLY